MIEKKNELTFNEIELKIKNRDVLSCSILSEPLRSRLVVPCIKSIRFYVI